MTLRVLALSLYAGGGDVYAYVGPGAGFALASSFAVILVSLVLAILAMALLPARLLWRTFRRPKKATSKIKRFIVVGLDGQDPRLTDRFMADGLMPNFKRLADRGSYHRLATTYPALSPVAWASFSTGTNPGKHNIFDFIDRDKRSYLPILSSARISGPHRFLRLGRFRLPLERPEVRLLRKSLPFWTLLGKFHIWSNILRVPITFPPDQFHGAQLSAMCTPDLLGTQGTFILFTNRPAESRFKEGGQRVMLKSDGALLRGVLEGPPNPFVDGQPPMTLDVAIKTGDDPTLHKVRLGAEEVTLTPGVFSDWVKLSFQAAPGVEVTGLCRLKIMETEPFYSLYMTPINLDPEKPALPISHPNYYSNYMVKKIGPYATLGLAEDTWALNEKVTDDKTFLEQAWDIDRERRDMFFLAMEQQRKGSLVCVFDGTDRIQHMFWRYLETGHPAAADMDEEPENKHAIRELYRKNDEFIGEVMERLKPGDVLAVCSDHGFTSFRRGVNLNAWLLENGYLKLKPGADPNKEWLADVDWSETRAYSIALAGIFLNMKGRESQGIVKPGKQAAALKAEIIERLNGLRDEEKKQTAIKEVFDGDVVYGGPYRGNAPDLVVGYNHGYRASWDCATGVVAGPVFEDNTKAWSADHCVDPRLVPGVLFCSHKIDSDDPAIIDLAPTILSLFGIEPPAHMDGKTLFDLASFQVDKARA